MKRAAVSLAFHWLTRACKPYGLVSKTIAMECYTTCLLRPMRTITRRRRRHEYFERGGLAKPTEKGNCCSHGKPNVIAPGQNASGFVLTHREGGVKFVRAG